MGSHVYICLFSIITGCTQINGNIRFTSSEGGVRHLLRFELATSTERGDMWVDVERSYTEIKGMTEGRGS